LANEGFQGLVIVATQRSKDRMQAIQKVLKQMNSALDVRVVLADLSSSEGCAQLYEATKQLEVSLVINNAGIMLPFYDMKNTN